MSYHAPKMEQQVKKPNEPLINMANVSEALRKQSQKKGYLSTFLSNTKPAAKSQGFLSSTLGNSTI